MQEGPEVGPDRAAREEAGRAGELQGVVLHAHAALPHLGQGVHQAQGAASLRVLVDTEGQEW